MDNTKLRFLHLSAIYGILGCLLIVRKIMDTVISVTQLIADILSYINPRASNSSINWDGLPIFVMFISFLIIFIPASIYMFTSSFQLHNIEIMIASIIFGIIVSGIMVTKLEELLLVVAVIMRFFDGFGVSNANKSKFDAIDEFLVLISILAVCVYLVLVIYTVNVKNYDVLEWLLLVLSFPFCFLSVIGVGNLLNSINSPSLLIVAISLLITLSYLITPNSLDNNDRLLFFIAMPLGVLIGLLNNYNLKNKIEKK